MKISIALARVQRHASRFFPFERDRDARRRAVLDNLKNLISALLGSSAARAEHRRVSAARPSPMRGLTELEQRCGADAGGDASGSPIFLFCAGWRSGSTLLQRLVLADEAVLVWGEPYARCGILPSLMSTLAALGPDYPPEAFFLNASDGREPASSWVANFYPDLDAFKAAHRAFFTDLFQRPALRSGAKRWGLKEVRLGIDAARYLRWLFPQAKFVFQYRNPYDAYRSYRARGARWYLSWPDSPVFTPTSFGRLWARLVNEFINDAASVDGFVVRYEDLVGNTECLTSLAEYLAIRPNPAVLDDYVGSSKFDADGKLWLPKVDGYLLRRAVEPLASRLGYHA